MAQVVIHNSHADDDVERASLAFVIGNTALSLQQEATILLTMEGVWVATIGYAMDLQAEGYQPLRELIEKFVRDGGRIWVSDTCATPRKISHEHLIPGAQFIGTASVIEAMVNGMHTISF
jgi:uncharacterized protein